MKTAEIHEQRPRLGVDQHRPRRGRTVHVLTAVVIESPESDEDARFAGLS